MKPADIAPRSAEAGNPQSRPEIAKRTGSALVLTAVGVSAVLASSWTFAALVAVAAIVAAWEWSRLVRRRGIDAAMVLQAIAIAAVALFVTLQRPELALIAVLIALTGIAITTIAASRLWSLFGLLYVAVPAWSLLWLRSDSGYGATALLYLIAVAALTDTASYAGGRLFGGPKLAPGVSPQKTWSGLVVGVVTPALAGLVFALFLEDTSAWGLAILSLVLAAACQAGDLTESAIKRRFGVKDMSGLIPGHGGLLDRIDGLLIAALAAAAVALWRDPASPGRALLIW